MKFYGVRDGALLGVNFAIAVAFLMLSSSQWTEPELRGIGASGAAPFVFTQIVFLLLGPLLLLNVVWLGRAACRSLPQRDWTPVLIFVVMAAGWISLLRFSASLIG